ncbi:MAG: DoxX family protein [Betaproteobacteria bacterium]|jgi:putative oxidoreductase|nr:DoxX family protein [Betaproteobacteria bacterium]
MNARSSAMAVVPLLTRLLIAPLFLVSAIRSLGAVAGTAGYLGRLGLPMPEVMAWIVIVVEISGAIMLIVGWKTRFAAWMLAAFVVVATLLAHRFWALDPAQYVNQLNHFLKNLAVLGGLLLLAAHGPGRLAFDRR